MKITAAAGDQGTPLWAVLAIALVPLVVALYTGVQASRAQSAAQRAEAEREKLRLLEQRIADSKRETYTPILNLLRDLLTVGSEVEERSAELRDTLSNFAQWIAVVGSDDAVKTFSNFMQSTFANAPAPILMRLYAEFQLAARRDLGDRETTVEPVTLLAMRINDLYTGDDPGFFLAMTLPFDELCRRAGWRPPWLLAPSGRSKFLDGET